MGAGITKRKEPKISIKGFSLSNRPIKEEEMQNLRQNYEVEGHQDRIQTLFHVTSPEAAKSIVNSKRMINGRSGMFGGGVYFAETEGIANGKAHYRGATITAEVYLGFSLICRMSDGSLNYERIHIVYGCHSAKGVGCVTNPEYVVYHWGQVAIKEVRIGYQVYYRDSSPATITNDCNNRDCNYYQRPHIGRCIILCKNSNCKFNGKKHLGECSVKCTNSNCKKFNKYHRRRCTIQCNNSSCSNYQKFHFQGKCSVYCSNSNCEYNQDYHKGNCKIKCTNTRCENYNEYHKKSCLLACNNRDCQYYEEYHKGNCYALCRNNYCEDVNDYHSPPCKFKCQMRDCENYDQYHKGVCKRKCSNYNCEYYGEYHKGNCS